MLSCRIRLKMADILRTTAEQFPSRFPTLQCRVMVYLPTSDWLRNYSQLPNSSRRNQIPEVQKEETTCKRQDRMQRKCIPITGSVLTLDLSPRSLASGHL